MSIESSQNTTDPTTEATVTEDKLQVLLFRLDDEIYALEISCIHEVLEFSKVTKVPRTPDYMLGVINLRGRVVPIIDLRRQFDMNIAEITVDTCNIIIDVTLDNEEIAIGILADDVREVIDIDAGQLKPAPKFGSTMDTGFIKGIANVGEDFVIVLDIAKIFESSQDFELAEQISGLAGLVPNSEHDESIDLDMEDNNADQLP